MTYAGVTSLKENSFWQTVKETVLGMWAYQYYVHSVRMRQDEIEGIQDSIDIKLAVLNQKEKAKAMNGELDYKCMLKILLLINKYPVLSTYDPKVEDPDAALEALIAGLTETEKIEIRAVIAECV